MSRILKRPMFRKGGSTNEGIMHGIVDRKGYDNGTDPFEFYKKQYEGITPPRDTSLYEMLIGGGLNLVSGAGAGQGLVSNIGKSYKGPSEEFFKAKAMRDAQEYNRQLGVTKSAIEEVAKDRRLKKQLDAQREIASIKTDPYAKMFIEDAKRDLPDFDESQLRRVVEYKRTGGKKLRDKVGEEIVGGIIDFDRSNKETLEKELKKLKNKVGHYFYDPKNGKYYKLIEENGNLRFGWEYDSIEEIDLDGGTDDALTGDVTKKTASEVILSQEDALNEAAARGLILIPERPEGNTEKMYFQKQREQLGENAVTLRELQEIIRKELLAEKYKNVKGKQSYRSN